VWSTCSHWLAFQFAFFDDDWKLCIRTTQVAIFLGNYTLPHFEDRVSAFLRGSWTMFQYSWFFLFGVLIATFSKQTLLLNENLQIQFKLPLACCSSAIWLQGCGVGYHWASAEESNDPQKLIRNPRCGEQRQRAAEQNPTVGGQREEQKKVRFDSCAGRSSHQCVCTCSAGLRFPVKFSADVSRWRISF